jgi:hypothetical protein
MSVMRGRKAELGGFLTVKGKLRYWIGVVRVLHPTIEAMVGVRSGDIVIGRKPLLLNKG